VRNSSTCRCRPSSPSGNAALRAIEFSGAIALFWLDVAPFQRRFPWVPPTVTMVALFCRSSTVTQWPRQMPAHAARRRDVRRGDLARGALRPARQPNGLALTAAALLFLLQDAAGMLANHRPDLTANAAATLGAATALCCGSCYRVLLHAP